MRTKVKSLSAQPATKLARLLVALEQELLEASDEEIMAAAAELGMNPLMKGSAAFAGLKYSLRPQLADFFEWARSAGAQAETQQISVTLPERTPPHLKK